MNDKTLAAPRAQSFFCDDVRTEAGGKFSLMGLYQDFIGIFAPEATLSKLTIFTIVDLPSSFAGQEIDFGIWEREQLLGGGKAEVPRPLDTFAQDSRVPFRCKMNVPFELIGFQLKDGMCLQVRVRCGTFAFDSPTLEVLFVQGIQSMSDIPLPAPAQIAPSPVSQ